MQVGWQLDTIVPVQSTDNFLAMQYVWTAQVATASLAKGPIAALFVVSR